MSKVITRRQSEQRELAWLLYTVMGAAGNLASQNHRHNLPPKIKKELAATVLYLNSQERRIREALNRIL